MKRNSFILGLLLAFAPIIANAQIPSSVSIRTIQTTDTTTFTISWTPVPNYSTYDLIVFSNPRQFVLEQFRVVTGNTWSIKVPRSQLQDSTLLYASVRVAMSPKYASITYRTPPIGFAALSLKPDSVTLAPGTTQQFCAFVVFVDGKVGIRNSEKLIPTCIDEYSKFPAAVRSPTTLQQSIADTVQVNWSVVNGSPAASTVNVTVPIAQMWIIKP